MTTILETGVTELIGTDEQVAQNQFAASVSVDLPQDRQRNGAIRSIIYYLNGAAVAISPAGELLILDADPAISAGDANLVAAEWLTILGNHALVNSDVVSAASSQTGAVAAYHDLFIPFHNLTTLYLTFQLSSATQYNSAGGDDESLSVNLWYELRN